MLRILSSIGVVLILAADVGAGRQSAFEDASVMMPFQRAADSYAFARRQLERRLALGEAGPAAIADAVQKWRGAAGEGEFFTPIVAAAFRQRLQIAMKGAGCGRPERADLTHVVPRINRDAGNAPSVNACIAAILPHLPLELDYRMTGVVLVLVDTQSNLVLDVLHAAFPATDDGSGPIVPRTSGRY